MKPGDKFDTSMVGPMVILAALVKIKIVQVLSSQGDLLGDPS